MRSPSREPIADPAIEHALGELREAIERRIRAERLSDRLTRLPNKGALDAWIRESCESESELPFWIAFIEIDRFKALNDKHGYDLADEMLKSVADVLRRAVTNDDAAAFRAHGDEFYVGFERSDGVGAAEALESIRATIEAIRVTTPSGPMACTVSVGWLLSADLAFPDLRTVHTSLELAVAQAKNLGRNRVVRFDATMKRETTIDHRCDCGTCHTKLAMTVARENAGKALACPVCTGGLGALPT